MISPIQRVLAQARVLSAKTAMGVRTALGRPAFTPRARVSLTSTPDHLSLLAAMVPADADALSLLDLGCGDATHTRQLRCARRTFVDLERRPGTPEPFVEADAIQFLRDRGEGHDIVFCLDTIEHLDRAVGEDLLRLTTAKARRLAVFFTPLGPMHIRLDHPMGHRTGWWPADFHAHGYDTWAFPRFHDPWYDGLVWGAFYAWKWSKPEPAAAARLAALAAWYGLVDSADALDDPRFLTGLDAAQAAHWCTQAELCASNLFTASARSASPRVAGASSRVSSQVRPARKNDAIFVRQQVPEAMVARSRNSVSLTFRNTGIATWAPDAHYALGVPDNGTAWGVVRANLSGPVFPGEETTFEFTVVAPPSPGTQSWSWRMVQEAVEWFGLASPPVDIRITAG